MGTERLQRVHSLMAVARALAAAVAAVLELAAPASSPSRALFAALAFAFAFVTMLPRRIGRAAAWVDGVFASLVMAGTGGMSSNYTGVALVVAVHAGIVLGPRSAAAAGAVVAAPSLPSLVRSIGDGAIGTQAAGAWLVLFPLAGLASGLFVRIWGGEARTGRALLAEANRVLSVLFRIARAMPAGLDVRTVAGAAMDELRECVRAPAGVLLLSEPDTSLVAASYGLDGEGPVSIELVDVLGLPTEPACLRLTALPPQLQNVAGRYAMWLCAPLGPSGSTGHLLAACSDDGGRPSGDSLVSLRHLADETAIGIENARLFAGVRAMSVDEERGRLARELHDGVVQSLAHVRVELEYLSRHPVARRQTVAETARLARVVSQAIDGIRATVEDLRGAAEGDLTDSLEAWLRDMNGLGGPRIVFEACARVSLDRRAQVEVFRIVQEAVSNAIRHAKAGVVTVRTDAPNGSLRVVVRDDGRGIRALRPTDRCGRGLAGGLGIPSMHERARRIGARLDVNDAGDGTTVELVLTDRGPEADVVDHA